MHSEIQVKISRNKIIKYSIYIEQGLLEKIIDFIPSFVTTIVIITDNTVASIYANQIIVQLNSKNYKTLLFNFLEGETSKNIKTKCNIENAMLENYCDRKTLILALGGGVVGDIAGFIAATYMRGINYIQIPTTLLAMVDSSIGGKTGINTPYGKNLIGAIWQPLSVIVDTKCLSSLSKTHFVNGLIEALKIFLIYDPKNFFFLQKNLKNILNSKENYIHKIIYNAIKLKVKIISQDEQEQHIRKILNFGHTIGHAIEKISNYEILHGYAVAYGILLEAKISEKLNIFSNYEYLIIKNFLRDIGIYPYDLKKYDINQIIIYAKQDKKNINNQTQYVLLEKLGKVYNQNNIYTHLVSDEIVKAAYLEIIGTTENVR